MLSKSDPNTSYRISNITVNTQLNTIEKQGETLRLEPKVMHLLDFLVRQQGEVCSKQQIIDEIWPRQIIANDVITRLIFVLRNTLGDDAKSPKFISTIPKKGYVFLVKAEPIELKKIPERLSVILLMILLGILFVWYFVLSAKQNTGYVIQRSLPVTHQDGREYDYAIGKNFSGYFHQSGDLTQLVIEQNSSVENDFIQNDSLQNGVVENIQVEDNWNKRSLVIIDNSLLYVRFQTGQYQIVQHTPEGIVEVLFESQMPIYTLSIKKNSDKLLFNQYQDNENTRLYEYSFVSKKVTSVTPLDQGMPTKAYSHFYQNSQNMLFFVGVDGRKPTIFGVRQHSGDITYEVNGFEQITSLASGRTANELIVTGVYRFIQGIWSVSLVTGDISLIYSHPESDIVQAFLDNEDKRLYYSFQGRRVDIKEVDFKGNVNHLQKLNSTLVERAGSHSYDGKNLYFASDRSGDFELYSYRLDSGLVSKLSQLNATTIWHYSVSNDQQKVAVVYSTDHIKLGVVDLTTGKVISSISLDEIKFPLAWSKNDQYIYISEHRSNIAMYLYDAANLTIEKTREHLGLTAFEISPNKIVAFDYQEMRFVSYDFNSQHMNSLSDTVKEPMSLAPFNTAATAQQAMMVYSNGLQKSVYRLQLSEIQSNRKEVLVANLLQPGNMQSISPDLSVILLAEKHKDLTGNIVALQLE